MGIAGQAYLAKDVLLKHSKSGNASFLSLVYSLQAGDAFLSQMGLDHPGAKADPTRLHVVDIWESSCDALAKALRYRCGSVNVPCAGIACICAIVCKKRREGLRS
eukprot:1082032-Pelagomonas_calceolata.AAC.2